MNPFKYRHAPVVYVLSALILLFTAVGCFFGVKSAIFAQLTFHRISYILLTATSLFLFIIALGIILFSGYKIKKGKIIIRLGVLTNSILVEDVTALVHLIDLKKLAIFLPDDRYVFAVIKPEDIQAFVQAVKEENPKVLYDVCYSSPESNKKR